MAKNKRTKAARVEVSAPVNEVTSPSEPSIRTMDTRIGIANRKNHAITVAFKHDSIVLSAAARTGIDYKEKDIVSVQGMTLQQAISSGICSIFR